MMTTATDLIAQREAIRVYRRASQRHTRQANVLTVTGWPELADMHTDLADLTLHAARLEQDDPEVLE